MLAAAAFFCSLNTNAQSFENDAPTMGWSSWNTFGVNISEAIIKNQANVMKTKGLLAVGYKYINIDDGYFGGRDSEGNLKIHPTRFPKGLKGVVDFIHSKGMKAGIYSDGGKNTCGSMFNGDVTGKGVGMYGHDQQDADFFFQFVNFFISAFKACPVFRHFGLQGVAERTETLGGTLTIDSHPGAGTRASISIVLPRPQPPSP